MSKKLTLTILSGVAASGLGVLSLPAQVEAADHISIHHMNFEEYGDKIKAGDNLVSIEKNLGLDWTLTAELGYDTVSGASPTWGPTTPVSGNQDVINRDQKTQLAQDNTTEVIRAGYDPYRDAYAVQAYELEDIRYSSSANLTYRDKQRDEWRLGLNYAQEEDYESIGFNGQVLVYADSRKNRSYTLGGALLFDKTLAFEEYDNFGNTQEWQDIFNGNIELGLSQIFTANFYATFTLFAGYKSGYLSNHYLTVLREVDIDDDGVIADDEVFLAQDTRPDKRLSGGINIQAFYSLGSSVVIRPRYKYFTDDWGVTSHQVGAKMSIELLDWLTLSPGYLWYTQTGADFFVSPDAADPSFAATGYATSDLRLGNFDANAYELGVSVQATKRLRLNALAAFYDRSNGYESQWWVVGATYEF